MRSNITNNDRRQIEPTLLGGLGAGLGSSWVLGPCRLWLDRLNLRGLLDLLGNLLGKSLLNRGRSLLLLLDNFLLLLLEGLLLLQLLHVLGKLHLLHVVVLLHLLDLHQLLGSVLPWESLLLLELVQEKLLLLLLDRNHALVFEVFHSWASLLRWLLLRRLLLLLNLLLLDLLLLLLLRGSPGRSKRLLLLWLCSHRLSLRLRCLSGKGFDRRIGNILSRGRRLLPLELQGLEVLLLGRVHHLWAGQNGRSLDGRWRGDKGKTPSPFNNFRQGIKDHSILRAHQKGFRKVASLVPLQHFLVGKGACEENNSIPFSLSLKS